MKAFLRGQKKFVLGGVVVLGVFVVYFFFFRSSAPALQTSVVQPGDFVQQVSVSGKVVAAQDVALGFSQSGRVSYVRGAVGDVVSSGEVLAEIENGDARALVAQKQATLASQQARLQSLKDGARPENIAVAQANVDGAVSSLAQANQGVINAILDAYAKSDDAVHNKVDQFISNPNTPGPTLTFNSADSQLAVTLLSDRTKVGALLSVWQSDTSALSASASDVVAAAHVAQANLSEVANVLAEAGGALNQAIPSQNVSQTTIQGYISNITTARTTINASASALNTALTAQKSAVSALDSARKSLSLVQAGATQSDLDAQAALVAGAAADVESATALLIKTRITAPFGGVITKMDAKVGEVVSPNTPEISMIGTGAFQIESYVPEINVSFIKVGNPATVTLDAYGQDVIFDATVVSIDPAETIQNGVSTYRAVLQFAAQDPRIKSGMTASVVITAQKKTGTLSVPQGLVLEKNGKKFLRVKEGESVVEVEVSLGSVSSSGSVEILSGLRAGDTIVTTLPTTP